MQGAFGLLKCFVGWHQWRYSESVDWFDTFRCHRCHRTKTRKWRLFR